MRRCTAFIIVLLLSPACWQRQDHDILLPETPHYAISGYTVAMDDTSMVLPYTPIHLNALAMLYDVTFETVSVQSDSSGYFQIDSVYPGIYVVSADRDGYSVFSQQFDMGHADRTLSMKLPRPWVSNAYYRAPNGSDRLAWGPDGLYLLGEINTAPEGDPPVMLPVIYLSTISMGTLVLDRWFPNPYPYTSCFTYAQGNFHLQFNDTLALLLAVDLSLIIKNELEDPLYGLTWDGSGFWSTYENTLQYRGKILTSVETVWEVEGGFVSALAGDGDTFWGYDRDEHLMIHMDRQGKVLRHAVPIDGITGYQIGVNDLELGRYGQLWVSGSAGVYTFDITLTEGPGERH